MNLLDIAIIILLVVTAYRWARKGLVKGLFSLGGFWLGIYLGAMIAPPFMAMALDSFGKLLIAVLIILGAGLAIGAVGDVIGHRLSRLTDSIKLGSVDAILGAAFSASFMLVIIWLLASTLSGVPFHNLSEQIRRSSIIQAMDDTMPPAPTVLGRISSIVSPLGFPKVFVGVDQEPASPVTLPSSAEVDKAVAAAGESTVKVQGLGCGGLVNGSGFVGADNLIVTNAHVVSGLTRLVVSDANGEHRATPVYFNSDLDIAILRVNGLAGPVLPMTANTAERGTAAAVLGYPKGGNFRAVPAGILRHVEATGLNIYGTGTVERPIYEVQGLVEQGNSGGPLALPDGTVIGVVFARLEGAEQIGYAIRSTAVIPLLEQTRSVTAPVSTGRCTTNLRV